MEKIDAVATLGQAELLKPARVKAALAANDRLKLYLSVLQAAHTRAARGDAPPLDLAPEFAAAGVKLPWLAEVPANAYREGQTLHLGDFSRICGLLSEDLRAMARPLEGSPDIDARLAHWCEWLARRESESLSMDELQTITSGRRSDGSLHVFIMDLHKAVNRLASELSSEIIDGAHVWQIDETDRPRIAAFMRGLNRTRALKLDHPGLDTAATRDGPRLLIQNDIGTNDAHVLVIQVEEMCVVLTYSDLHRRRFAFFQSLLAELGGVWGDPQARATAGLNLGETYYVGTVRFDCEDEDGMCAVLEGIGVHIVFLIDWNRARKRLESLVGKADAVAVLTEAARRQVGHMAWLSAGGEKTVFGAMQALGPDYFRIGDRLDRVMGADKARGFLLDVMELALTAVRQRQPLALVADDTRLLLARHLNRYDEFELLAEHAAYCHALAEALHDGLARGHAFDASAARHLAEHAKDWERRADQLVEDARARAETRPMWDAIAELMTVADDVADALEEAAFLLSLIAADHHQGWRGEVLQTMQMLSEAVLGAVQDHVRAVEIARGFGEGSCAEDHEAFVAASWRVMNAERQCDVLLRDTRRALTEHVVDAATLSLSTDFAQALEASTDWLLATGYGLRKLAFSRMGVGR
ncbi:MAG: phosphate transport regulator [Rhodocyclaceae bacterium]